MEMHISGRGVDVSPGLRRRAESQVAKVTRLLPKITEARVVLGRERYRHLAEVTLQAKRATFHAEGAAADLRTALDLAVENLDRQVRRRKDRLRTRKPRASRRAAAAAVPAGPGEPPGEPVQPGPEVLVRWLAAKPMSVDEALEQMRTRRDGLLVFTNARSQTVNVLRRRADGRLELVQPVG